MIDFVDSFYTYESFLCIFSSDLSLFVSMLYLDLSLG